MMKQILLFMMTAIVVLTSSHGVADDAVNVLVFTGGHDFDRETFFAAFEQDERIQYTEVVQPDANRMFTDGRAMEADILVLYDMWQPITEEEKEGFLAYLKSGKGLVAVHHCIASYQAWPEFSTILGGKYLLEAGTVAGEERPASTYKHDVDLDITVLNAEHPVLDGIDDFTIFDEGYGGLFVSPDVEVLLHTDHPEASGAMAWVHTYGESRVAYLQLGHGPEAFANPNFQRLMQNAVHWASTHD